MTAPLDRQEIVALIDGAMAAGARQATACAELGLNARTLQRWTGPEGTICDDRRLFAEHPEPANKLRDDARDRIVAACCAPEFASLPPSQIVPRLADQGIWIASESSFYRVLRERCQNHRRWSRPAGHAPQAAHQLRGQGTVPVLVVGHNLAAGAFLYLYFIADIFSRKIVGWEVHDRETAEFAVEVLESVVWAERCLTSPLVLHADGRPNEGRYDEGDDGETRRHRVLQPPARQQ